VFDAMGDAQKEPLGDGEAEAEEAVEEVVEEVEKYADENEEEGDELLLVLDDDESGGDAKHEKQDVTDVFENDDPEIRSVLMLDDKDDDTVDVGNDVSAANDTDRFDELFIHISERLADAAALDPIDDVVDDDTSRVRYLEADMMVASDNRRMNL
jgi:hypothetical protein